MIRRAVVLVLAVVIGLTLGCVDFTPPLVPPGRGGPPWTRLTSRHFVLLTDVKAPEARRALSEFETYYRALVDNAFPGDELTGERIRVVLFARVIDLRQFVDDAVQGFAVHSLPGDPTPIPTIALHGTFTEATRTVFLHELTHHIIARHFRAPPTWLNEGLALYWSTLLLDDEWVYLGLELPTLPISRAGSGLSRFASRGAVLRLADIPPASKLIRLNRHEFYEYLGASDGDRLLVVKGNYAGSLALVHMLHHGDEHYRGRYRAFLARVRSGQSTPLAWSWAFGNIPDEGLDEDFYTYYGRVRAPFERRRYVPAAAPPIESEQTMPERDVLGLWEQLRRRSAK